MDQWDAIGRQRVGRHWRWSEAEVALLLSGQPIPHRTAHACSLKLWYLGIRKGPGHYRVRTPYELPIPVPGKIPWPTWWQRAHVMRSHGYGATEIARILDKHIKAVRSAIYPSEREKRAQRDRPRTLTPEWRARKKERDKTRGYDRERVKLRSIARIEWRAAGGDPRALDRFYRAYECL